MQETRRWKYRPEPSTWGDFGPDDEIGRLNLITPQRVREAIMEVKTGINFCLSMRLDYPGGNILNPRRTAPVVRPLVRNDRPAMNYPMSIEHSCSTDVLCDDFAELSLQYSTQWDSLAHLGQMFDADGDGVAEMVFYNGYRAGSDIESGTYNPGDRHVSPGAGARRLGVDKMAAARVQGRGVLIDLEFHFGPERRAVSYRDLESVMAKDRIEVREGDFVCLHTGFARELLEMGGKPDKAKLAGVGPSIDGRDPELQRWVRTSGLVALVADNNVVEFFPARPGQGEQYSLLPLHELCLFRLGVYLGEYWYLTELAEWLRMNDRHSFFLTAPPLRLPGAVGSPVTPIATV